MRPLEVQADGAPRMSRQLGLIGLITSRAYNIIDLRA